MSSYTISLSEKSWLNFVIEQNLDTNEEQTKNLISAVYHLVSATEDI